MATNSIKNSLCVTLGSARNTFDAAVTVVAADTLTAARTEHQQTQLDSLQIVVSASELSKVYSPMDLSAWMNVLKPKAAVSVQVLFDSNTDSAEDHKKVLQTVHTSFLLAGLVGTLERKGSDGSRVLEASKKYSDQEATGLRAAPIRVSIQMDDDFDDDMAADDDDFVDEDNLLADTSNLLAKPPSMSAAALKAGDDCGGRKACDDCSCGRAEAENGGKAAQTVKAPIKSSACGKCNLGDAFRCASCPYLGKPAFKAGEEHLTLDLQDDF
jgi:hypothetical protein